MFLDYFALTMILIVIVVGFYAFIYIHELPYEAAKHRNHPQQDAIYVACWLSLFTLHALWPIVFLWALSHQPAGHTPVSEEASQADWSQRVASLEARLQRLESERSSAPQSAGKLS